ncbi:hypothetical protein B7463_g8277, partial [Scytalidium lignicola]
MTSPLPPDPYRALGVDKTSSFPEIRSAYRKLVLKCHPDKVNDASLKAIKQDEFQKVQQAYELLSNENRRLQYDEQVKLFELRREMGRGNPTARSNPFEYEVRTAEPRSAPYSSPRPKEQPNGFSRTAPRSYEDIPYDEPRSARKSASYESERKRDSREEEMRRETRKAAQAAQAAQEEIERARARLEKEARRATHSKREKTRDKERKRGSEEKYTRHAAYVEEVDSDDAYARTPPKSDKKSTRRMEEEIRMRNEEAKERNSQPILTPKWDDHKEYAAQYMQASRQKGLKDGLRRAETFTASPPAYNVRYAAPVPPPAPSYPPSDDDTPRRSSARSSSRRPSETPGRSREKSRSKSDKRSRDPYIVEPSPPPSIKKPGLHSYPSAPPVIPGYAAQTPRSQSVQAQFSRKESAPPMPPMPRASTFQAGDGSRGSRLKKSMEFESESDSDSPAYAGRRSASPPPRRQEETRYHVSNGRSIPIPHRSDPREDEYSRDRSPSPSPRPTRLAPERGPSGRQRQYHTSDTHEPIVIPVRPKMSPRETGHRSSASRNPPLYDQVKWSPSYGPQDVVYTTSSPPNSFRRDSDPGHREYSYPTRNREFIYT